MKMVFLMCLPLFLLTLIHLKYIDSAPTENVQAFNFEDDWKYEVQPNSVPLLTNSGKTHQLPTIYTYEEDLNIDDLETKNTTKSLRIPKKIGDVVKSKVSCNVCTLGVSLLLNDVLAGATFETIKSKFVALCVSFKIETELVCTGFFDVFGPEVVPAFNTSHLGAKEACSLIFGETCGEVEIALHNWRVDFPEISKPKLVEQEESKANLPVFKVLHLSDTHFDPEYAAGSPANCEEPLCCRNFSTPSINNSTVAAGRWGAYEKCDSPKILIENMLKSIATEHPDIDYIIWTGDLPPHDIWKQSKQSNIDIIKESVDQMFEIFPETPIFPALGNHESVPAGNFAPPWMKDEQHSVRWLYNILADQWRRWLPTTSGNTILHGGFYSVLLRPGFRLISLNTNYCHTFSWWLLVNSTDPAQELKWLIYELQEAEKNGEKVHLIGHIPPGSSDCMKTWSHNFYSIVERFESTITAQFYGHSHADEFEIFYETTEYSRPISVAYLGPSVTTYENFNPAYRIYYIEGDHEKSTREVLDHETWTMDLGKANEGENEPSWFKLYSAKDAYRLHSLKPIQWNRLIERMVDDTNLFDAFYRNYYRNSPRRPDCDGQCKLQILCDLKSGRSHDRHHLCHDLEYNIGI
ncbi:sphingomyelin phosphodiesterase-like [Anoplophora glabripennis]|uniref:sphingomyelin phosphodiesterase-like n=1 Tax=Anoplophora glabripennis TaxID=217634 RepID=UPI0008751CCE|nr:sphingomyelin phosphodiesterase-like [Anoplophora glabripennis]